MADIVELRRADGDRKSTSIGRATLIIDDHMKTPEFDRHLYQAMTRLLRVGDIAVRAFKIPTEDGSPITMFEIDVADAHPTPEPEWTNNPDDRGDNWHSPTGSELAERFSRD